MKLKNRLIVAFISIIILPILLSCTAVYLIGQQQMNSVAKTYGFENPSLKSFSSSIQAFNSITKEYYKALYQTAHQNPEKLENQTYLEDMNQKLCKNNSFLIVRESGSITYTGKDGSELTSIASQLPSYGVAEEESDNGTYLGGDNQTLVKQIDYVNRDGKECSAFIVTAVGDYIPEIREYLISVLVAIVLILILTACCLIFWLYRGILKPLNKLRGATQNIKEGNLDFELKPESDDEFGALCVDFESMRLRLKRNAEEKLENDKDNKELLTNISHDLKTPITAIKGYAEGIMDGVADTPEKQERYIKTIYNKAEEMNTLINELTLYSKVDTNRIPYNFNTVPARGYFEDCAEDLRLELESKGTRFIYSNTVGEEEKIIADPEQIKRVIHNIVNNSVKYMGQNEQPEICLRVKDVGDFVQVELEDNGQGIAAKDLPYIFDRFYRSDSSRNSSKGGSGIGLSIVKKIIEEHGGNIWATSKEGEGTVMSFVIRKYQEVPVNE